MTKFLNISTDNTLGGNSPSDVTVSSQKAIKDYVDNHSSVVTTDGTTISTNSSQELQAIGTVNKNIAIGATNPIYDWEGTLAEYNSQAVAINHPEWICYITDDVSGGTSVYTKAETDTAIATAISAMLGSVYPVGSVYITTANTCPLSALISGSTWELVSSGRVLQGADNDHAAGTTIEAGLPNITGTFVFADNIVKNDNSASYVYDPAGCFYGSAWTSNTCSTGNVTVASATSADRKLTIDASRSSSIYGNSSTVQPPAYVVNIYRRTA